MRIKPGNTLFCLFLITCVIVLFPSCRVAKNLPEGESLLVKNKFVFKTKAPVAVKQRWREDLAKIAAQKPNIKVFGFAPIRMWLYYSSARSRKLTKFKQWMIDKVGEAPVVYDSSAVTKSLDLMGQYIFNSGYFHETIKDTVITKKKKTQVIYTINTEDPWIISEIDLPKGHTTTDSIVRARWKHSYFKNGDRFDITNVNNERKRIETDLKNRGFYFFNREYVTFYFDTFESHKVKIQTIINKPSDTTNHIQYYINNIYVITDYATETLNDTSKRDTLTVGEFRIIYKKLKFRKRALMEAIFFKHDDLYSREAETRTYNRLAQQGVFKFTSIDCAISPNTNKNYLDVYINLTPGKKHGWGGSGEVTVSDEGLFGTLGSIYYLNKNLTKGADQLRLDESAGVQLRFSKHAKENVKVQLMSVNVGSSITYYINRFPIPLKAKIFSKTANPRTRISLSYNFEHRYDFNSTGDVVFLYQLHNFNLAFGYEWQKGNEIHHLINPLTIDFYLLPKTGKEFIARLDSFPILKSSFQEQVIIGPSYSFQFSNHRTNNDKRYMDLRLNMETAGNIIYSGFKLANLAQGKNDSVFLIAKRPFSQYVRAEIDFRNYFQMNLHSMFALRTFTGLGVPYGNSKELPFVKQFFVGGPNSLRGFNIREVGPGAYADPTFNKETGERQNVSFFNQTGDIKMELNAEIRFDIYKWLKGAIFADAGNVWTIRNDGRQLGYFEFNRFWKEFAVDAGAGLRLDFNFFVVRFDYGFPLRDPRRVEGKRWQFENGQAFKIGQFQLAIGYPF